jgi:hypothetical protein
MEEVSQSLPSLHFPRFPFCNSSARRAAAASPSAKQITSSGACPAFYHQSVWIPSLKPALLTQVC